MVFSGLAKKNFFEVYQRSPWKNNSQRSIGSWPLLEIFLNNQHLSYLDYMLTCKLLAHHPHIGQEVAFFICHLILAVRNGHLCVYIDGATLQPEPKYIWQQEEGNHFSSVDLDVLKGLILKGAQNTPSELMSRVKSEEKEYPETPLYCYQNLFYLQRHWLFETRFLKNCQRLNLSKVRFELDAEKIKNSVQSLCKQGVLLEEQAQAITQGCLSPLSLITGGPGTGKTYTAGYLIKIFWEHLSLEQRKICQIALAAPTGKAAANLQKSLGKVVSELEEFPNLVAKTLHGLLGIKGSHAISRNKPRLAADLILVDESSMIDIKMMAYLLEAVRDGSRLILLGDPYQLPSVEAGSVFSDLIHLQTKQKISVPPCTHLKICLRAELRSIIEFANLVNTGKADEAIEIMRNNSQAGISHISMPHDKREGYRLFIRHVSSLFPALIREEIAPSQILSLFNATRILSSMRKGPYGVDALNRLLWEHFSKDFQTDGWLAVPIMIVINDYRQNLFNGETGVLMRKLPLRGNAGSLIHSEDYALFASREGEEIRKIPAILLPKYEYAYCLSVHKSQGSEFDRVVLMMPEGSELFGREVFYTGVTRARKQLDIYGSELVLHKTITQQGLRLSGLSQRFAS